MRAEPLGESAYILRDLDMPAYELAEFFNAKAPAGLIEAVASYDTVGLYVDPTTFKLPDLSTLRVPRTRGSVKRHRIPVCYAMGLDTDAVCASLGLTAKELQAAHVSDVYRCYAVGFCPGFAYLGYLPDSIAGVPRRSSPRTEVEPGSVAITGRQTAVYPLPRPGGWSLIGKTPLCLVDEQDDYFPIKAGDEVQFEPITVSQYEARMGERL